MKTRTMLAIALCASALCFSRSADAALQPMLETVSQDPGEQLDRVAMTDAMPLSSDEMSDLRGGFVDPTGLIYNFSVNVQTALNGADVFTRSINLSSGPNGQLQASSVSNLVPGNVPTGLNVGVIGNGSGVSVTNATGGITTILNQTATGAPASIIVSTGSNLNVTQTVSATLTLQNLATITNFLHTTVGQTATMAQHTALRSIGF